MFKTRFHLKLAPNHATLTWQDGRRTVEGRPTRPFSYGGKIVGDREALTGLLQSLFKQVGPRRFLIVLAIVDVEVDTLVGDDEAGLRSALRAVGATTINVVRADAKTRAYSLPRQT